MGRLALLLLAASRASAAAADEPGADALPGLPFLIVTTQRSGSTWLASMLDLRRSERQEQPSEHRRLSAASSDTHDGDDDEEEGVPSHVTSLRVELLELMQTSGTSTADIFRFIE